MARGQIQTPNTHPPPGTNVPEPPGPKLTLEPEKRQHLKELLTRGLPARTKAFVWNFMVLAFPAQTIPFLKQMCAKQMLRECKTVTGREFILSLKRPPSLLV